MLKHSVNLYDFILFLAGAFSWPVYLLLFHGRQIALV